MSSSRLPWPQPRCSVSNFVALDSLSSPGRADLWLFARWAAVCLLALTLFPLAGTLVAERPPRSLLAAAVLVTATSLALWPSSDLIYRHRLVHGLPSYGPLNLPTELVVIAFVFGYLCFVVWRAPSGPERLIVGCGILGCGFRAISYTRSGRIRTPVPAFSYTP